jgi:hypothetical protein
MRAPLDLNQNGVSFYFNIEASKRYRGGGVHRLSGLELKLRKVKRTDDPVFYDETQAEVGVFVGADAAHRGYIAANLRQEDVRPIQVDCCYGPLGDVGDFHGRQEFTQISYLYL